MHTNDIFWSFTGFGNAGDGDSGSVGSKDGVGREIFLNLN